MLEALKVDQSGRHRPGEFVPVKGEVVEGGKVARAATVFCCVRNGGDGIRFLVSVTSHLSGMGPLSWLLLR